MDIYLSDPSKIPLPRDEVRILDFKAYPYPDGHRVRVTIELTPFLEKPNGDIVIQDKEGNHLAAASFIETIIPKFDITLHLRQDFRGAGEHTVVLIIFYTEDIFTEEGDNQKLELPKKVVVDEGSTSFSLDDEP